MIILENDFSINIINKKEENNTFENESKNMNIIKYENKILGEIYINGYEINEYIQINNLYENYKRVNKWKDNKDDRNNENKKEIKENIE